jgi:hypothetical protein
MKIFGRKNLGAPRLAKATAPKRRRRMRRPELLRQMLPLIPTGRFEMAVEVRSYAGGAPTRRQIGEAGAAFGGTDEPFAGLPDRKIPKAETKRKVATARRIGDGPATADAAAPVVLLRIVSLLQVGDCFGLLV